MSRKVAWLFALGLLVAGASVLYRGRATVPDDIAMALRTARKVLVLGANMPRLTIPASIPDTILHDRLSQPWSDATAAFLRTRHFDALLVGQHAPGYPAGSAGDDLQHGRTPQGMRALVLSRTWKVYSLARSLQLHREYRQATAYVARRILSGAPTPSATSFPEELRRIRNCEVVVMVREGERARLWRSAKGSSIARALTTAAVVARQRWVERETTMGEPLERALERMNVEVSLIEEDGNLLSRDDAFLDEMVPEQLGIGFESTGLWRYILPADVPEKGAPRGRGQVGRAFRALFASEDMPSESQQKPTLRLYRFTLRSLGISTPQQAE